MTGFFLLVNIDIIAEDKEVAGAKSQYAQEDLKEMMGAGN